MRSIIFVSLLTFYACRCETQRPFLSSNQSKENIPLELLPDHNWWNLLHYSIAITPDYDKKFIKGTNIIRFQVLQAGKRMQIDLLQPMLITAVKWESTSLKFERNDNAYLISFPRNIDKDAIDSITIYFEGNPQSTNNPPWESGWIWTTDKKGRPWMSIACEGTGAAIWLPCKNILYDEPDNGVSFSITVPDTLAAVANGRLYKKNNNKNGTTTWNWNVTSPINNYNIIPSIGKYVSWHKNYHGVAGNLDCDYWVLDYNHDKAKKHLEQTDTMLICFEDWLGPYPFYKDSYKLVEAPMPGMEHQSAIAYGNNFENGYSGKNLSGTTWGQKWDFILIHESGHEWFGNSITANNDGESWIHEGFTKYLETIYTGCLFGEEAGNEYCLGIRKRILNDAPVLGGSSSDAYNKGSAMLHMIRQITGDSLFRIVLRGLNKAFYHSTVSTTQILNYINQTTQRNFTKIVEQYLKTTMIPRLEYSFSGDSLRYKWSNCVQGFDMPLKISFDGKEYFFIYPTEDWKYLPVSIKNLKTLIADKNFYINI